MPTCTEGHTSTAADYCDVCGAPIGEQGPERTPSPEAGPAECPACQAPISGRFCEACGHDSALPAPAPSVSASAPAQWTAVLTADRDFYERVLARGGPDTVEFPEFFPARRIVLGDTTLIGRGNREQGVQPDIDLGIHPTDWGVSTQHAVLRVDESGLTITDLGSTNGTTLNGGEDLLKKGDAVHLNDGDRVHLGAWTTITVVRGGA